MLLITIDKLKSLWSEITEAMQERYSYLTEAIVRPVEYSPATPEQLEALKKYWGFALPPSYRLFLSLYNGVENFAYSTPLLSIEQIMQSDEDDWDVVDELDPDLVKFVFAGGAYSDLFFCFDFRTAKSDGEYEVVIFTIDGNQERHASFMDFLQTYLDTLRAGIVLEKADRDGLGKG